MVNWFVIASMIGVAGLGQQVLRSINNQFFALGLFNGIAIVVLARLEQRYSQRGVRLMPIAGGWSFQTAPDHLLAVDVESLVAQPGSPAARSRQISADVLDLLSRPIRAHLQRFDFWLAPAGYP